MHSGKKSCTKDLMRAIHEATRGVEGVVEAVGEVGAEVGVANKYFRRR